MRYILKLGNPNKPPFIIAEISANHNGSLERALATISAAKQCGADAVKIQTYTADTMTIDCGRPNFMIKSGIWYGYKLYDLYKCAQTPYEWHKTLFEHAKTKGIILFSTPFDETAIDLLKSLKAPIYKIASFEITDLPLIQYAAKTGKPIIISTGMASEPEIEEAINTARVSGCKDLVLLHCISSYPTPIEQVHLRQIPVLAKRFKVPVGLSDHTLGTTASVVATGLGACVIEKHFTLSRGDKGPDSEFSLEPEELRLLCHEVRKAWMALGKPRFRREPVEVKSKMFRRSLYVVKDMKKGEMLNSKNMRRIRPGYGLPPKMYYQLIGKKVNKNIKAGTALVKKLIYLK